MFHLDWLRLLLPRSKKAALILVLMFLGLGLLFTNIVIITMFQKSSPINAVLLLVGILIGLPASTVFYYLQNKQSSGYSEIDTLDHYYKSEEARSNVPKAIIVSTNQPTQPLQTIEKEQR